MNNYTQSEGVLDLVQINDIKRKSVRGLLKKRAKEYKSDDEND